MLFVAWSTLSMQNTEIFQYQFFLIIQYGNLIKSQIEKKEEIIYILGG